MAPVLAIVWMVAGVVLKIIGKGRLPTNHRVSVGLKMAASTLRVSNTYLGAQFRRFRARLDARVAVKTMAAKLARLSSTACGSRKMAGSVVSFSSISEWLRHQGEYMQSLASLTKLRWLPLKSQSLRMVRVK
jgi:hypothetical protein